ncbi:MAG: hypothetical protein ACK6A7_13435 [Planctomycetota bacterium]
MRLVFRKLHGSATTWLAIALAVGLSSGCQQWSLRKNMNAFFGGEPKDDWEPPARSNSDEKQDTARDPNTKRPWWNRRTDQDVSRVILPRDRKKFESSPAANATANAPKLPSVELIPPEQKSAPARASLSQAVAAQGAKPSDASESRPQQGLVGFGVNPTGLPGSLVASASETNAPAKTNPTSSKMVETGVNDVDLEASLKSLPPEFREVVQRTLQAVKEGKSLDKPEPPVPSSEPMISPELANKSEVANKPELIREPEPKQPVAFRLSESNLGFTAASAPANLLVPSHTPTKPNPTLPPAAPPAQVAVAVASPMPQDSVIPTSANLPIAPSETGSPKPVTWHGMISEAIERLESDLEAKPSADESLRRSQELTLRMLYVSQRRLDDALRPIERMDEHEQEYVRHQMQALYEASNPDANPSRPRHWSTVMMSQREATSHLAAISTLEVRSVAFCTQVDGYGTFVKFPKSQFLPDQDILLYCEIDNVAAEKVKAGFETQLQGSYEIRDVQGRLVADQDLPMEPEVCMNHRRDYFMVYRIYMPSQIPPGNYELRLTVQDKKGGKYGHSTAAFEIRM